VAAAVMRLLTWSIRVPLRCYSRSADPNDRNALLGEQDAVAAMIAEPWERGNAAQLVQNLLGPVLVHGNSLTLVDDNARSGKIQLTPKDWRFTQPIMPWRGSVEGFRCDTDVAELERDYSIDKCLHIAPWSPTGPIGTSPLMQLGITLQVEDAAQRYQKSLFEWGGRPPTAVIASEAFLGIKPAERQQIMAQLRSDLNEVYGGPDKSGKPALLPPGLDWKTIGQTTVEAALIDQRKVAREEVCAVYLIPPPMLGILEKATYSNIETQREMVYTDCLGPPLIMLEQAINAQVIRDLLQRDDVFVEFDFSQVLRGDRLAEIEAIRDAIGAALLSPNEGRRVIGMPSSDEQSMNEFYLPANNLKPITGEVAKVANERALAPPVVRPPIPPGNQPPPPPGQQPQEENAFVYIVDGREHVLEPA
jgi:HK97 family phage portal protein